MGNPIDPLAISPMIASFGAASETGRNTLGMVLFLMASMDDRTRRGCRSIWANWSGTANEIAGAAVGAVTVGTAAAAGLRARRKKREAKRKQDDDNRALVEGLPALIRDLNANMSQMSMRMASLETKVVSVDAGISANTGTLILQTSRLRDIEKDIRYVKQRRQMELDESGVCWWECNEEGLTIAVSQPLCDLFGMTEDHMLKDGKGWLSAIEGHNGAAWQSWIASVKDRIPYRDRYTIHNRKTRKRVLVESSANRFEDSQGNTILFYGTVRQLDEEGGR